METEFRNFNNSKALQGSNISVKIVKSSLDIFQQILHQELNRFIELSRFPGLLKATNMTPAVKKYDRANKQNNRPISILPNLPKVLERRLFNQLHSFFDKKLSVQQCKFWNDFSV